MRGKVYELRYITFTGCNNLRLFTLHQEVKDKVRNLSNNNTSFFRPSNLITRFKQSRQFKSDAPIVTVSSKYMTDEEKYRADQKAARAKWISKDGFLLSTGKSVVKTIPNYVGKSDGLGPLEHNFREKDKRRWVSKDFSLY